MPIDDLASMRSWQNTHNTETDTKNNISVVGAITVLHMPVSLSLWAGTSGPFNLRSLCVSAGWMYKLSVVYVYF